MALAAVPMAGRCLSGLRRLRLLRREPVGAAAGTGGAGTGRSLAPWGVSGGGAGALGSMGTTVSSGGVHWESVAVASAGIVGMGARSDAVVNVVLLGGLVRARRLVASRYVIAGGSSPPGDHLPPSDVANRVLR